MKTDRHERVKAYYSIEAYFMALTTSAQNSAGEQRQKKEKEEDVRLNKII